MRGTLDPTKAASVPAQSPLYPATRVDFTDTDLLSIQYYTSAAAIQNLIPQDFELADEPLVTCSAFNWGFSPFGAYTEYITMVEVTWEGAKYDFALELILENEGALFMGREQLGVPKVIGRVVFPASATPRAAGYQMGHVERPPGHKILDFGFKPERKIHGFQALDPPPDQKPILVLRILPHLVNGRAPVVREYVKMLTLCTEGELWAGTGSLGFSGGVAGFALAPRVPIRRLGDAFLLRRASFHISPESMESFRIGAEAGKVAVNGKAG